jgi:hypothetical protein
MSTKIVLQFGKLEEFVQEDLHHGSIVRVVALDITESVSSQIYGLHMAGIGVHVRVINDDGQILACYLPVARIQLYNGRNEADPVWREYDKAWDRSEALKERVITYLEQVAAEKGFAIRAAGVIDASAGSALSPSQGPIPPLFYPLINECLALPLLANWSEYLWANGREQNLITLLDKGEGQGYAAWRVLPALEEWQAIIESGLQAQNIAF